MNEEELFEVEGCSAHGESGRAIHVKMPGRPLEWIPQSLIHDDSEVWRAGDVGKLVIPLWFAEKKGWTDE